MADIEKLIAGDRVAVVVTPAFGKPRLREGEVFSVSEGIAKVEVRAPGLPNWPCTVETADTTPHLGRPPTSDHGALKPGDEGDEVTALQAELHALGFGIARTGVYDIQTRVTVEEFQKAVGMVPHGFATKATRDRLTELVRCNRAEH
ncbi:peptidoglycan-binding domain-containing protein [Oricola sp.]|uniref:peptidoglycan-binding domain-containing protein n=1 Tax=Oricola sp. TaxID=1979950 RepID=UPI0025D1CA4B|nr:peptidoglycan-binding domain-containing protein [Oricola sp.]MCI5075567.1 peptidoglycan-binding protein [Oricola sp.]